MTRRASSGHSSVGSEAADPRGAGDKPASRIEPSILASLMKPSSRLTEVELASEIDWHEDRLRELRQQRKARKGGRASARARPIGRKFNVEDVLATYVKHGGYGAHKHTC